MDEHQWIKRCAEKMIRLRPDLPTELVDAIAQHACSVHAGSGISPEDAALIETDLEKPDDEGAG